MRTFFFVVLLAVFSASCTLAPLRPAVSAKPAEKAEAAIQEPEDIPDAGTEVQDELLHKTLLCTFAGDLMAHKVNFTMGNYDLIYDNVKKILHNDDFSFINVETPVCDTLPLSTYPSFNVHTPYLRAAVHAGFDVLSFANNHTNDHGVRGIDGSLAAVRTLQEERAAAQDGSDSASPPLIFSGLKDEIEEPIRVVSISYRNWNILFCSVTELLNSYGESKKRLYYSAPTKEGRAKLLDLIQKARIDYPCDLFILSLHLNEPEYIRTVSPEKKEWFKQLGEAGIDIIWAHHPHVMQPWEIMKVKRFLPQNTEDEQGDEDCPVVCMYSMGNFISGQRWNVRYDNPAFYREYTGDAVLLQLQCTKNGNGGIEFGIFPILITQYNDPAPVVKQFTQEWINALPEKEKLYFKKRFLLMKEYLPFTE
ncbi:MAG: CapA family protein [Treponema sp.]